MSQFFRFGDQIVNAADVRKMSFLVGKFADGPGVLVQVHVRCPGTASERFFQAFPCQGIDPAKAADTLARFIAAESDKRSIVDVYDLAAVACNARPEEKR